ncbi:UDP-2,3-diacylglucosamine diphosphatase [Algiphilus aromaticivorans]|uniref:UDP-2,3-diacylglucosamine diphosphatase n=1 Tax=Algiphilus aromaticivorans TaxID=382454 RepID=UPI000693A34C|nr:UDP-2,3-diacylglucosamine diphosphatase [Algiphilus aromaticivorans]
MTATRHNTALLVSDIHLPAGASEYRNAFLAMLEGPGRAVDAIYLLGDIFEYWLGEDVSGPDHRPVLAALAARAAAGTRIYFIAGNRDLLLDPTTQARHGVIALPDPVTVQLPDGPALLSHGDQWCTQDAAYQRWRRFAHNPIAQKGFLHLPAALRRRIARRLRTRSSQGQRRMPEDLLDVQTDAVEQAFRVHGATRIIHGHTHRPARHRHAGGERIVLPDWRPGEHRYLLATRGGLAEYQLN